MPGDLVLNPLTNEHLARIESYQRMLADLPALIEKCEATGMDCTQYREMGAYLDQYFATVKATFFPATVPGGAAKAKGKRGMTP